MMRRQDPEVRLARDFDDVAAISRFENRLADRFRRGSERDLGAVQAEHQVPFLGLLDLMGDASQK